MMENLAGSGSNAAMQKLMQQKMLEEMFGLKASERPTLAVAQPLGTDENSSFGILGLRLFPATMTSPIPRLEMATNGKLSIHPEELRSLIGFLQSNVEALEKSYEELEEKAKGLEGAELFGAAMGVQITEGGKS